MEITETYEWLIRSAHNPRAFVTISDVPLNKKVAYLIQRICDLARTDEHIPAELCGLKYDDIRLSLTQDLFFYELDIADPLQILYTEGSDATILYYHLGSCDCVFNASKLTNADGYDSNANTSREPSTLKIISDSDDFSVERARTNDSGEANLQEFDAMDVEEEAHDRSGDMDEQEASDLDEDKYYEPRKIPNPQKFNYETEQELQESLRQIQVELDAIKTDAILASQYYLLVEGFPRDTTSDDITTIIEDILDNLRHPPKNPYKSIARGPSGTVLLGISSPKKLYERLADTFITGLPEIDTLYFYSVPMGSMPRMFRATKDRAKRK